MDSNPKFDVETVRCPECANFKAKVTVTWGSGEIDTAFSPRCYTEKESAEKAANDLIEFVKQDIETSYKAVRAVRSYKGVKSEYIH